MKTLILIAFVTLAATSAQAMYLECQNLGGNYFYVDTPMRSIHIQQTGCALSIIHQTDDTIGTPLLYSGDGTFVVGYDSKYYKEIHAGFAAKDSYILESKMLDKDTGKWSDQKDTLKKTSDGNIIMSTVYSENGVTVNGAHLLQRSE